MKPRSEGQTVSQWRSNKFPLSLNDQFTHLKSPTGGDAYGIPRKA